MATGQKRGCCEMEKPEASSTPLRRRQWKATWSPSAPARATDCHELIDNE